MSKMKSVFSCQGCGYQSPKWLGKCPDCNQWNSFAEETSTPASSQDLRAGLNQFTGIQNKPLPLKKITEDSAHRSSTHFQELNRVLGGGIVAGSLVLIGGDPGIGKSTILMQGLRPNQTLRPVLYVSGEESAAQIKLRASRLGVEDDDFYVFAENQLETILDSIKQIKPRLLIIDSIQTVFSSMVQSAPGSVSQVRECTGKLMVCAKTLDIATFIVGHVTKDGAIAGPKVLEHIVDTVLYFEGSNNHPYRILRAVKNRFGSTNEIGVFEMIHSGLREVANPSELFLQERPTNAAGTIVVSALEGSRPILVELQALVSSTNLPTSRRTTLGLDHNKVSLLIAVIEKRLGIPLYGHDVFVNVAGGIYIDEPAVDLGTALALVSSFRNRPLDSKLMVCGEVGLTGEIRRVSQLELRLSEAEKLGFERAIVPKHNLTSLPAGFLKKLKTSVVGVGHLGEAFELVEL